MISRYTRSYIKGYLEGLIQRTIDEVSCQVESEKHKQIAETQSGNIVIERFRRAILPDGLLKMVEFHKIFSASIDMTFKECAHVIAGSYHRKSERDFVVKGPVSGDIFLGIDRIMTGIRRGEIKPDFLSFVQEIVSMSNQAVGHEYQQVVDLYIETITGEEWYFVLGDPKPNKGQCIEATGRLLQILAIRHEVYPKVKGYYAMAYNPYGSQKSEYKHSFALNYMDMNNEVLLGKEFWDLIGGHGTYEEILGIYQEVGREKGSDMIDQLALGY